MKRNKNSISILLALILAAGVVTLVAGDIMAPPVDKGEAGTLGRKISIDEFISLATKNDTVFEQILIDELVLQYRKDLKLPANDIVVAVKGQYDFMLSQNREEPATAVSLSRLFPYTGTTVSAEYEVTPSFSSTTSSSEFTFKVSQSIARNAFGKSTRLQDKIIGFEVDVAEHQIIEAYEDYLATIIVGYYEWYEAYENLRVAESSYRENLKLLDNIKQRQKSSVALSIDVNKINLQVLAKEEALIELRERYQKTLNFVRQAIRYEGTEELIPDEPDLYAGVDVSFDKDYAEFTQTSRTYKILNLLEEKSSFEVAKNADDLLPSINLLFSYNAEGDDFGIKNEDNKVFAGVSMDWPLPDKVERAEYETSKVNLYKTKLSTTNAYYQLHTDIKNLFLQIERERQLASIAREKIELAQSVLKDEAKNYSFGKVTLNDYIAAVNVLDNNRFNLILHDAQRKKLLVEWLRITDRLIRKEEIATPIGE